MSVPLVQAADAARIRGEINRICVHSVSIAPRVTDTSGYNKPGSYGTPVAYPAYVAYNRQEVRGPDGQLRESKGKVILAFPPPSVGLLDQLTLPDGSTPPIIKVEYEQGGAFQTQPTTLWF